MVKVLLGGALCEAAKNGNSSSKAAAPSRESAQKGAFMARDPHRAKMLRLHGPVFNRSNNVPSRTHTPGPWSVWTILVGKDKGKLVIQDFLGVETVCSVTRKEDARLIAAVPELLAALRDLMKSCQNWAPTIDRSRARAAIAKAEGKS